VWTSPSPQQEREQRDVVHQGPLPLTIGALSQTQYRIPLGKTVRGKVQDRPDE